MAPTPPENDGPEITAPMAMVMLDKAELPPTGSLFQAYKDFPQIPQLDESIQNIERKGDTVTFTIDGEMGFITLMRAPIPWSDLEGPCATSLYWPDATKVLKPHKGHLILSIIARNNDLPKVLRAIFLTKLTASVAVVSPALGVYWPTGTIVQSIPFFLESTRKIAPDCIPLELWVEFRLERLSGQACNVITTGMDVFGHREIEVINSKRKPQDVLKFVINLVAYLFENGPVIQEGDTVGEDGNQKITVEFQSSTWDRPEKVMKILY